MKQSSWKCLVECKDCGTMYEILNPNWSKDVMPNNTRIVLLYAPNRCPKCRNLKIVDEYFFERG